MRVRFYYSPLKSLSTMQRDMDRLLQSWWDRHSALPRTPVGVWSPPTDVYETASDLVVKVEMAGTTEEQVQITLYEDYLVISGRRDDRNVPPRTIIHQMDIWYGEFRIEVPIPVPIDHDGVEACYENGMIYITLPKSADIAAQPRHVPISTSRD